MLRALVCFQLLFLSACHTEQPPLGAPQQVTLPPAEPVLLPAEEPEPPPAAAGFALEAEPDETTTEADDFRVPGSTGGVVGGTVGPTPTTPPDRTRPARPKRSGSWDCAFPAAVEDIDDALVILVVTVTEAGSARGVSLVRDPGHGFGRAARECALAQGYEPALDEHGKAIVGTTSPIAVRFTRR